MTERKAGIHTDPETKLVEDLLDAIRSHLAPRSGFVEPLTQEVTQQLDPFIEGFQDMI